MLLEPQDVELFFRLHRTLMFFVNQRLNVIPDDPASPEEFAAQFDKFQAKKDAIYALYRNEPALSPKRAEQSLHYYDDFYKTIGNQGRIKYEFLRACGNKG